jgi:hypothetical protein
MVRLIGALMLVLVLVTPSLGQQSPVGTYKLVSVLNEVAGAPRLNMGQAPRGYLVITPTRFVLFITAEKRTFGASVADKAELFETLVGYGGTYRVEGDKLIETPDVSWTENLNGKTQVETWQLSGNRLTTTWGPTPWPRDPSKTMLRRMIWEKVE